MFAFDESVDSEDSFVLAQELARVGCASIDLIGFSGPRPVTVGLCLAAGVAVPVRVEEEGQFAVDAKMRDLVLGSDQDVRVGRRVTSLPRSAMFRFAAQHGYDLVIDPRSQVAHRLEDDGRGEGLGPPATRGRAR